MPHTRADAERDAAIKHAAHALEVIALATALPVVRGAELQGVRKRFRQSLRRIGVELPREE